MRNLLYAAGTAFLRSFGVTFLFAATGILTAPNYGAAKALSLAGLVAAIVAGLRSIQVFLPQISFSALMAQPYAAWADSFVRTFLSSFLVALTGWLAAPDWGTWHSALLGIVLGAATAAVRAIQGLLTKGETPTPASGIETPHGA